ncbi:MAG: hypothetical protein U9O94_02330 [Nanoarchaeota archaeon]|nr:hypothetical protein [Nanoarchaeota archaeon]
MNENRIKTKIMIIFDLLIFSLGVLKFFNDLDKEYAGIAMLNRRIILQSRGMCRILSMSPNKGRTAKPNPILMMFLSRKLSEFFKKNVRL